MHPLEAYLCEKEGGALTDEQAKDSIAGLVNDPDLLRNVCAMFGGELNGESRCFAMGKVYDAEAKRFGCITVLSEDVAGVIGNDFLQKVHEDINYALMCSYIEFCRFCQETGANDEHWDDYLNFAMQKGFPPLFKNGVRARLIQPSIESALPMLVFIIFLKYDEW